MYYIQNNSRRLIRSIDFQDVVEPIGFIALGILQMWKHYFGVSSFNFGIVTVISCVTVFSYNIFTKEDDLSFSSTALKKTLVKVIACGITAYGVNVLRGKSSCSLVSALRLTIYQSIIIAFKQFVHHLMEKKVTKESGELMQLIRSNLQALGEEKLILPKNIIHLKEKLENTFQDMESVYQSLRVLNADKIELRLKKQIGCLKDEVPRLQEKILKIITEVKGVLLQEIDAQKQALMNLEREINCAKDRFIQELKQDGDEVFAMKNEVYPVASRFSDIFDRLEKDKKEAENKRKNLDKIADDVRQLNIEEWKKLGEICEEVDQDLHRVIQGINRNLDQVPQKIKEERAFLQRILEEGSTSLQGNLTHALAEISNILNEGKEEENALTTFIQEVNKYGVSAQNLTEMQLRLKELLDRVTKIEEEEQGLDQAGNGREQEKGIKEWCQILRTKEEKLEAFKRNLYARRDEFDQLREQVRGISSDAREEIKNMQELEEIHYLLAQRDQHLSCDWKVLERRMQDIMKMFPEQICEEALSRHLSKELEQVLNRKEKIASLGPLSDRWEILKSDFEKEKRLFDPLKKERLQELKDKILLLEVQEEFDYNQFCVEKEEKLLRYNHLQEWRIKCDALQKNLLEKLEEIGAMFNLLCKNLRENRDKVSRKMDEDEEQAKVDLFKVRKYIEEGIMCNNFLKELGKYVHVLRELLCKMDQEIKEKSVGYVIAGSDATKFQELIGTNNIEFKNVKEISQEMDKDLKDFQNKIEEFANLETYVQQSLPPVPHSHDQHIEALKIIAGKEGKRMAEFIGYCQTNHIALDMVLYDDALSPLFKTMLEGCKQEETFLDDLCLHAPSFMLHLRATLEEPFRGWIDDSFSDLLRKGSDICVHLNPNPSRNKIFVEKMARESDWADQVSHWTQAGGVHTLFKACATHYPFLLQKDMISKFLLLSVKEKSRVEILEFFNFLGKGRAKALISMIRVSEAQRGSAWRPLSREEIITSMKTSNGVSSFLEKMKNYRQVRDQDHFGFLLSMAYVCGIDKLKELTPYLALLFGENWLCFFANTEGIRETFLQISEGVFQDLFEKKVSDSRSLMIFQGEPSSASRRRSSFTSTEVTNRSDILSSCELNVEKIRSVSDDIKGIREDLPPIQLDGILRIFDISSTMIECDPCQRFEKIYQLFKTAEHESLRYWVYYVMLIRCINDHNIFIDIDRLSNFYVEDYRDDLDDKMVRTHYSAAKRLLQLREEIDTQRVIKRIQESDKMCCHRFLHRYYAKIYLYAQYQGVMLNYFNRVLKTQSATIICAELALLPLDFLEGQFLSMVQTKDERLGLIISSLYNGQQIISSDGRFFFQEINKILNQKNGFPNDVVRIFIPNIDKSLSERAEENAKSVNPQSDKFLTEKLWEKEWIDQLRSIEARLLQPQLSCKKYVTIVQQMSFSLTMIPEKVRKDHPESVKKCVAFYIRYKQHQWQLSTTMPFFTSSSENCNYINILQNIIMIVYEENEIHPQMDGSLQSWKQAGDSILRKLRPLCLITHPDKKYNKTNKGYQKLSLILNDLRQLCQDIKTHIAQIA